MKYHGTEEIETDRLILRKFVTGDLEQSFHNWASDEKASKYFAFYPHNEKIVTESLIKQWINAYEKDDTYIWAISTKENDEVIGHINADSTYKDLEICEIAYMLGSKWWNKGYATEALNAILHYLFYGENYYLIEAKYNSSNIASGRLLEKVGMKQDGILRDRRKNKETGERNDLVICSITYDEFDSTTSEKNAD